MNKPKVYITRGLPASGKTTWAKEFQSANCNVKRINRDDLRAMIDNGVWSKQNENVIVETRNLLLARYLALGYDVIIDDTNLSPKVVRQLREFIGDNARIDIVDFTNVSLEECIKRDEKRPKASRVGYKVIGDMYDKYLRDSVPSVPEIPFDPNNPTAIICDLDGTLALRGDRHWFEWDKVDRDDLNAPVAIVLDRFYAVGNRIILTSGRKEQARKPTLEWLERNGIPWDYLYMRADADNRGDDIVKREMYDNNIRGKFNILFVLDDRDRVVKVWRDLGLACFQVNYGDF